MTINNSNISCVKTNECLGCTLCESLCNNSAIVMEFNVCGFTVPKVDDSKCTGCKMCITMCPALNKYIPEKREEKVYAGIGNDKDRKISSSGAIFPAIARSIIREGGMVCGCLLNEDLVAKHVMTDNIETIKRMSDSKYVQSELGSTYKDVILALKAEKRVLFTGTSCQIDGLLRYARASRQSVDNLICVDLICHGVPSPRVFHDYLKYYELKRGVKIIDYSFRSKKFGWGDGIGACNYIQNIKVQNGEDNTSFLARIWQNVFFSDLASRECCFQCNYTTPYKPADITLGDYWGVSSDMPEMFDRKGTSLIITHNSKGESTLRRLGIHIKESNDYSNSIMLQSRLQTPVRRPNAYDSFWRDYPNGFDYIAKKYFKYSFVNRIKYRIKMGLYSLHLYGIANKLFEEILF